MIRRILLFPLALVGATFLALGRLLYNLALKGAVNPIRVDVVYGPADSILRRTL